MKTITPHCISILAIAMLPLQIIKAQGTVTYLSNLNQPSAGSQAVGSDLWYAAGFGTGPNAGGYVLNSIQLGMVGASNNPSGFMALIYSANIGVGVYPGSGVGTLNGSLNPAASGIYTFTSPSGMILSPNTAYFIVLTAGTVVANGAYEWSLAGANSYNPNGGWNGGQGHVYTSSNGLLWNPSVATFPQFAITATPIPEPGILSLFALGGLSFLWRRRKR